VAIVHLFRKTDSVTIAGSINLFFKVFVFAFCYSFRHEISTCRGDGNRLRDSPPRGAPSWADGRARELIQTLHLSVLPKESGYLKIIGRSAQMVTVDGRAEKVTLGLNIAAGQRPVVAVPGGCWKALRLHEGAGYALMANTLSPEFTPDRVKIGAGPDWVKRFTNSATWATPKALSELIGPNWMPE